MDQQVLVVGKHRLTNEALQYTLKSKGYIVTIEDINFYKIQSYIHDKNPDFVIWDESIVGIDFNRILSFSNSFPSLDNSILILNSQMLHYMAEGLLSGIQGFLHINSSISELISCLHTLERGAVFISNFLICEQEKCFDEKITVPMSSGFTPREMDILRYVKQKKSSKEIAKILNVNYRTIQNQRQNMCNKLGLSGRGALYKFAVSYFNSKVINSFKSLPSEIKESA